MEVFFHGSSMKWTTWPWVKHRESESEVAQLCPTLSNPMDCSLPGSSVHGIFQARVLEWGAIAFSIRRHRCPQIANISLRWYLRALYEI